MTFSGVCRRATAVVLGLLMVCAGLLHLTVAPASAAGEWVSQSASASYQWRSVIYGNGLFVAIADNTRQLMTSPDGVTWTAQTAPEASGWESVTFGNGLFVVVASNSTGGGFFGPVTKRVMTSPDGINWTARTEAAANQWKSVTYGNGLFVAVASSGTSRVMTSADGSTWAAQSAAEANSWMSVTYGNGVFVAVAVDGTHRVMTSSDGLSWTAQSASSVSPWRSVTFGNGTFVAVSTGNYPPPDAVSRVMTSTDGSNWTARTATEENSWWSVTYGNGRFVALANDGANRVMTSTNGSTWTSMSAAADNNWKSVTFGNNTFVAVASDGEYRVMTWAQAQAPAAPTAVAATSGNGSASVAFTAGADGGAAITKYQYRLGAGSWVDAGLASPISITGLANYTTYSIQVRAVNGVGPGAASGAVTARPQSAGPAIGVAYSSGKQGVQVGFAFNRPAGSTLVGFTVRTYAKGTTTVVSSCQTTPSGRSCYIPSLTSGTEYDIRVQAYFTLAGETKVRSSLESATSTVRVNS
ncbi:MAG: hypothetical protein F2837_09100 [Actinobacteria bacterium]|uniref:Unannotated protein n=1 Tax=freshwater metagenome TaxID=449393 RepID=A0A6J7K2Z5_9ZZZZ|nr:hypothetical protein [Actinomycetota bacterium]